ncbi:hypothetical protein [Bacteroides sp. GM023]|uniref:hypothetical protein n=1 Tax=Bacteroides sp. GM023 TaxID=2723058 RepID=UPI00168A7439|nr:hypothetical protein [Bacteroides sp. GM023]MBD3589512.1 hypothetical protein [Bacteroides sp. GM023]
MQEEIKCPKCGGNKFNDRGNDTYRCMYCGTTFGVNKPEEIKPHEIVNQANTSPNVTVNVNLDTSRLQKPQSSMEKEVAKGIVGGAGMAAGGCLTGTAIAIIIPIIIFLFIIAFINGCVEGCASALRGF